MPSRVSERYARRSLPSLMVNDRWSVTHIRNDIMTIVLILKFEICSQIADNENRDHADEKIKPDKKRIAEHSSQYIAKLSRGQQLLINFHRCVAVLVWFVCNQQLLMTHFLRSGEISKKKRRKGKSPQQNADLERFFLDFFLYLQMYFFSRIY